MRNLLLPVFMIAFATAQANNYYFSNDSGDDSRTALQAQNPSTPWRSIDKLNSFFSSLSPGDAVLFKRGETFFGSITISRSGAFSQPITIGAYGSGAKPVITGFTDIGGWRDLGGGAYESPCASCLPTLNMVTINDTLQPMGRYPKANDPNGGYWSILSHGANSIQSNNFLLGPIWNLPFVGGEVVMRKFSWIMDRSIITGQGSYSLTYSPLPFPHPYSPYQAIDGNGFFIQNHQATFSKAGDWSYDGTTKMFKVYSIRNGVVKGTVIENLVNISSRNNLVFDNLALKGSNSKTFNIATSNNIQINNCDIAFSGIDAIYVSNDVSNNITVSNCTISNTNNTAITANNSSNWIIRNNIITNTGMNRGMGLSGDGSYCAMAWIGSMSLVEYNEIRNTGYHGIFFIGHGVVIKNNLIENFCMVKSDGGGIYNFADRNYTGRQILGNIILNGIGDRFGRGPAAAQNPFSGNVHGIYLDGGATDVLIDGNTVVNCSGSGLELSSSSNVQAINNTLFNNTQTQIMYVSTIHSFPVVNLTVQNNILFAKQSDQLISLFHANSISGWGIDNNYYCRPISEPQGIDTYGYSNSPSLKDYPDGGIIQAPTTYKFYSLDKWKTLSGLDLNSRITQATNIDANNIRLEYNATNQNKTISLGGDYRDVKNNLFTNSVTLSPYSSIILMKTLSGSMVNEFNADKSGNKADLSWTTPNSATTLFFEVERSGDGLNFSPINKIPSKTVGQNNNKYNYTDINPSNGNNFYRLKQVGSNGKILYSKSDRVFFGMQPEFQVSPNPVRNQMKIVIDKSQFPGKKYLVIQTLSGNTVQTIPVNSSLNSIAVDMSNFPPAQYLVTLIYKDYKVSKKIIKIAQ